MNPIVNIFHLKMNLRVLWKHFRAFVFVINLDGRTGFGLISWRNLMYQKYSFQASDIQMNFSSVDHNAIIFLAPQDRKYL